MTTAPVSSPNRTNPVIKLVTIGLIAVVVGVGGFVGGMQFQKGQNSSGSGTANASAFGPGGQQTGSNGSTGVQGQMAMNGSLGTVTAVSAASITVKDQRAATTKTYSISSSTTVTDNGSTATASDIAVGDLVMVQTSSSTATEASSITLNPTMGGSGAPANMPPTSST